MFVYIRDCFKQKKKIKINKWCTKNLFRDNKNKDGYLNEAKI